MRVVHLVEGDHNLIQILKRRQNIKAMEDLSYHFLFLFLFIFRYLRLVVHIVSFWCFYRKAQVPDQPSYSSHDVTVIIPTVDPANEDFSECLKKCLANKPKKIIIVTIHARMEKLRQMI